MSIRDFKAIVTLHIWKFFLNIHEQNIKFVNYSFFNVSPCCVFYPPVLPFSWLLFVMHINLSSDCRLSSVPEGGSCSYEGSLGCPIRAQSRMRAGRALQQQSTRDRNGVLRGPLPQQRSGARLIEHRRAWPVGLNRRVC